MAKFTIEITTDNDAFCESLTDEIMLVCERAVGELFRRLEVFGLTDRNKEGPCRDTSGNTVGQWRYEA